MSHSSKSKYLPLVIAILALLAVVKLAWVIVAALYLPKEGVSREAGTVKRALHYRYKLASDVEKPQIEAPVQVSVAHEPSIKNIRLVGIYSTKSSCIVTLLKKGKSYILANGEEIDGFVLKGGTAKEAYFERSGKKYTLKLFEKKRKNSSSITGTKQVLGGADTPERETTTEVTSHDGVKVVPRSMLKNYTSDISKAMKDIGLRPVKRENNMLGYKVRFIRRGSPFSKLGLKRGDVIKAINGEEIVDFNGPMNILKSADTIEGLTITVVRKNEEKELEYEVK